MGFIVVGIPEMVDITSSWVSRFASFIARFVLSSLVGVWILKFANQMAAKS